jgi:hypothetical protein
MGTKVIDNNEARVPFLGDRMSFVSGLDPLGLQNPSSQAYSFLLPGLNNVTGHIRNYSFYCWLLEEYAIRIKSVDPLEQKIFIRRAEYIIALLSVFANIEGISGSNYATNRRKENTDTFDLQRGTFNPDGSTEKTYWQYPFGVFGQYYIGSLRQIGLIEEPVDGKGEFIGIYRRTSNNDSIKVSGQALAASFNQQLNQKNKELFFKCINNGAVTISELEVLAKDFNLTEVKPKSKEQELLITLLIDIDQPGILSESVTSMRKDTMFHVLNFIKNNSIGFEQREFTKYAYSIKGKVGNEYNTSLTGWYYYQLNEYFQVACTATLNGSLDYLQELVGPSWMSLPLFITQTTDAILKTLIESKFITSEKQLIKETIDNLKVEEDELYNNIIQSRQIDRLSNSILMMMRLFSANESNIVYLRDFTNQRHIGDDDDVLTFYLDFAPKLAMSIRDFVHQFILLNVIERHQYIAYRKMVGIQSTQKFIIEDNFIRHIDNFDPGYTSPRLNNLRNFLYDLKLIDDEYMINDNGKALIK